MLVVWMAMVFRWIDPYETEWAIVFPYTVLLVFFLPVFCWLVSKEEGCPVVKQKNTK